MLSPATLYLCQDLVPDAYICKVTVQAGLRPEASSIAVLVLSQYQRPCAHTVDVLVPNLKLYKGKKCLQARQRQQRLFERQQGAPGLNAVFTRHRSCFAPVGPTVTLNMQLWCQLWSQQAAQCVDVITVMAAGTLHRQTYDQYCHVPTSDWNLLWQQQCTGRIREGAKSIYTVCLRFWRSQVTAHCCLVSLVESKNHWLVDFVFSRQNTAGHATEQKQQKGVHRGGGEGSGLPCGGPPRPP